MRFRAGLLLLGLLVAGVEVLGAEPATNRFKAEGVVVPGIAAPDARGRVKVEAVTRQGLRVTKFRLTVQGAPTNAELTVYVNGVEYGTVWTDKHGKLRLKGMPESIEPEELITMEFYDPEGTNALTISF